MDKIVIEAKDLSRTFYVSKCKTIFDYLTGKAFKNKIKIDAVHDINFKINQGEVIGLVGINGAGKSTLIKMMTGILAPTSGELKVLGKTPFKSRKINNLRIAAVFGQRCQLRWDIAPIESYKLFKCMYRIPDKVFNERMEELEDILELKEFINQPVRTLSLGQKMRSELAGAFLHNPEIIFLDEPTIGLDVFSKDAILNFLLKLKERKNVTIILTTHDLEDIKLVCDRLLVINKGKLQIDDSTENVIKNSTLNSELIFKIEKGKFIIPSELIDYTFKEEENVLNVYNVTENSIATVINYLFSCNKITDVQVKKPEFKDIFMDLFGEVSENE